MSAMQGALSAAERSMRSVFVGNIPYEATEEQLKDIFSEVGPVVSFRLVYDRETGKPKGYGFCEYKDQEMALSAMRNLNGYELNGRALRVDNAASEKSKEELKNLQASLGGPPVESPYGPDTGPEKAPEEISKAVASLPPEQMFELMKQMKMCIENNPNEARNLLLQNPQLAYALLQAQVIMRIVDPQVAMGMLHRPTAVPMSGSVQPSPDSKSEQQQQQQQPNIQIAQNKPNPVGPGVSDIPPGFPAVSAGNHAMNQNVGAPRPSMAQVRASLLGERPPVMAEPPRPLMPNQFPDRDPRAMTDRDMRQPPVIDRDMRPPPMLMGDKDMRSLGDQDLRNLGAAASISENRPFDPRFRNMPGPNIGNREQGPPGGPFDRPRPGPNFDPRSGYDGRPGGPNPGRNDDPRNAPMNVGPPQPGGRLPTNQRLAAVTNSPILAQSSPNPVASPRQSSALAAAAAAIAPHDQEKAALIMQVLQLSDQQIAMLPPEQRQSIMILKEQIARSQQLVQ